MTKQYRVWPMGNPIVVRYFISLWVQWLLAVVKDTLLLHCTTTPELLQGRGQAHLDGNPGTDTTFVQLWPSLTLKTLVLPSIRVLRLIQMDINLLVIPTFQDSRDGFYVHTILWGNDLRPWKGNAPCLCVGAVRQWPWKGIVPRVKPGICCACVLAVHGNDRRRGVYSGPGLECTVLLYGHYKSITVERECTVRQVRNVPCFCLGAGQWPRKWP